MYYNHELVYENTIPTGTLLWSGSFKSAKTVALPGVNSDWSNIRGVKIYWKFNTSFETDILKENMYEEIGLNNNLNDLGLVVKDSNSNSLIFKTRSQYTFPTVYKIETL